MTRLLTKAEVLDRVALSYPSVWRLMRRGEFPRGLKVSGESVRWVEAEVEAWIRSRQRQRLKGDPQPKAGKKAERSVG